MKKLLTLIVLMVITIGVKSQTLTATLQQGDVITPFYGENAFIEAYDAAEDGAVITLSVGYFKFKYGSNIEKSLSIIGSGAFGSDETITYVDILCVRANNVRIEGVYFKNKIEMADKDNVMSENTRVRHCYIKELRGNKHSNSIIDQCVIEGNYVSWGEYKNFCVKNCIIKYHDGGTGAGTFINNIIYKANYPDYVKNDMFRNCVIGIENDNHELQSPGQYYNNVFFRYDDNLEKRDYVMTITYGNGCVHENNMVTTYTNLFGSGELNLMAFPNTEAKGDDNTKVGPEGGSGFKLYPSIPRIISKSIDRQTDAEGKINVSIQVAAE